MAQFLYNFDVELLDPAQPWHVHTVWFAYQHDMFVRVTERMKRASA